MIYNQLANLVQRQRRPRAYQPQPQVSAPPNPSVGVSEQTPMPANWNPFFDPNSNYGFSGWPELNLTVPWWNTDMGRNQIEEEPIAAYFSSLGPYNPMSGRGRFLESQTQRVLQGYRQAQLTNPELWLREYLGPIAGNLERMYQLASPEQKGYQYGRFAPPARTIPRPS